MKKTKKLLAIFFVLILVFVVCSCNEEDENDTSSKSVSVRYKSDYPYISLTTDGSYNKHLWYVDTTGKAYTDGKLLKENVKTAVRGTCLFNDGTVEGTDWKNIVEIAECIDYSANSHLFGLRKDGTVAMRCENIEKSKFFHVTEWTDIIAISASRSHIVGLKSDGTVVATGQNSDNQCDVEDWKDIVAVYSVCQMIDMSCCYTFGIKKDGTVVSTIPELGSTALWCDKYISRADEITPRSWTDITALSISDNFAMGLKSDGTVVTCGTDFHGETKIKDWKDIVAIKAFRGISIGIKSDGTVVSAGDDYCVLEYLNNKKLPQ